MTKAATKREATILTMWSRWRRVRNMAASKDVTDFEQDFNAYAACIQGDKKALHEIMRERMKEAGLSKVPKMSESKFKTFQAGYMDKLNAR